MRVKSLYVENLLTFDKFELSLDGGTHTIVGSNGSGKSNVVRLFDLVMKAINWSSVNSSFTRAPDQLLRSFASAHHYGENSERPAIVRMNFELSTPLEKLRLTTFMRAAILCTLTEEIWMGNHDVRFALSQWAEVEITEDKLEPLFTGTIVLKHFGSSHIPWDVSFEFIQDGTPYKWDLSNRAFSQGIVSASESTVGYSGSQPKQLRECLLGMELTTDLPVKLPLSLPPFNLASICPLDNRVVTPILIRIGSGAYDQVLLPFRNASEILDIPVEGSGAAQNFTLAYFLSIVLDDGIIILEEQFRGLGIGGRTPQQVELYPWEILASPVRNHAPGVLPIRMFELKNGSPSQRAKFTLIQKTFTELAPDRSFDVKFQAIDLDAANPREIAAGGASLSSLPASSEVDRPGAAVMIVVDRLDDTKSHPQDLPIQFHGAGTWEALVLAETLVEADDRFVILDEPALTLHPSWQRALSSRIQETQRAFLVVTHSADLVPMKSPDQLARLVRLENESGQTRAHRLPRDLSKEDAGRIVKTFSASADAISLLFARGVVLLEGETELGLLPNWFANCAANGTNKSPADLDLAFYSVNGDQNFKTLVRVMNAFGIPWVLICDGAAFDVQNRKRGTHIFGQVLDAGVQYEELKVYMDSLEGDPSKRIMDTHAFNLAKKLGWQHGVFTFAESWRTKSIDAANDESFEMFLEGVAPGQLDLARGEVGDSKVRQGLWVAEHVKCPIEVNDLYEQLIIVLQRRGLA